MATNEAEVLREVFPKCLELLHVKDVTPYLFAKRVINSSEYEELCGGSHLPSQRSLAERLLVMMMRKGRRCATHLLLALQDSVRSRYPQPSHRELIDELSKALRLDCDQSESDSPDMPHANGNSNGSQNGSSSHVATQSEAAPSYLERSTGSISNPLTSNEPIQLMKYRPYLETPEKEKLRMTLATESRKMLEKFTTFVVNVSGVLRSESANIEDVQLALQARLGRRNIDEHLEKKIDDTKSFSGLLKAAMPFSSWYNYDLIAYLAKQFGGQNGESLVETYKAELQSYLKRLVFECPPFSSIEKAPNGFEEMVVKLDETYVECTVQDITILKEKLCDLLGRDDPNTFILKSIEEGCVQVTWIFPRNHTDALYSKAALVKSALARDLNVIHLRIGTKMLSVQSEGVNGVSESAISMSVSSHADDHSQQHIPEASVATNVDNKFAGQDEGLPLWKQVLLRKRANEPKALHEDMHMSKQANDDAQRKSSETYTEHKDVSSVATDVHGEAKLPVWKVALLKKRAKEEIGEQSSEECDDSCGIPGQSVEMPLVNAKSAEVVQTTVAVPSEQRSSDTPPTPISTNGEREDAPTTAPAAYTKERNQLPHLLLEKQKPKSTHKLPMSPYSPPELLSPSTHPLTYSRKAGLSPSSSPVTSKKHELTGSSSNESSPSAKRKQEKQEFHRPPHPPGNVILRESRKKTTVDLGVQRHSSGYFSPSHSRRSSLEPPPSRASSGYNSLRSSTYIESDQDSSDDAEHEHAPAIPEELISQQLERKLSCLQDGTQNVTSLEREYLRNDIGLCHHKEQCPLGESGIGIDHETQAVYCYYAHADSTQATIAQQSKLCSLL